MKKKFYLLCMLIVLSFTHTTFAQTTRMGSGMFNPYIQHEPNLERVKYNCYYGVFGTPQQKSRILHAFNNISTEELSQIMVNEITKQMGGEPFDPTQPLNYTVTYEIVDGSWWDGWLDSYLYEDAENNDLQWGDPRKFKANRDFPDKQWCIATITSNATGASAKLRANCGNVLKPVTQTTGYRQVAQPPAPVRQVTYQYQQQEDGCRIISFTVVPQQSNGPGQEVILSWATSCQSVTISGFATALPGNGDLAVSPQQTTTYTLTTNTGRTATVTIAVLNPNVAYTAPKDPNKKSWFGRNWGYVVGGAAIIVGGYYGIKAIKGKPHTPSGSYNNGFQGGSDGSGASGGQGQTNTW